MLRTNISWLVSNLIVHHDDYGLCRVIKVDFTNTGKFFSVTLRCLNNHIVIHELCLSKINLSGGIDDK